MTIDEIREFVAGESWRFAKTYAEKAPHEYIVRDKINGTDDQFVQFVLYIREYGFEASFWRKNHIYLPLDGKYYWTMGAPIDETIIINRCRQSDYELFMRKKE